MRLLLFRKHLRTKASFVGVGEKMSKYDIEVKLEYDIGTSIDTLRSTLQILFSCKGNPSMFFICAPLDQTSPK